MESRREFLRQATVTLILVPIGAAACGSSTSPAAVTAPLDAGANVCAVNATSTVVNGHTHMVCVTVADLVNPPSGGMTITTSVSQAHTHTVTLTQSMLETIAGGGEVTVATSLTLNHNHEFMLVRMAGTLIVDAGAVRASGSSSSSSGGPAGGTASGSSSGGGGPSGTPSGSGGGRPIGY
jgi:hypothetical protein